LTMKGIRENVQRALSQSGRADLQIDHELDFPALGNQRRYLEGLASFLARDGQLPVDPPAVQSRGRVTPANTNRRMTLHGAIELILAENGNHWMTTKELAEEVNLRSLYIKRDSSPVTPFQIHGRTRKYPQLFEREGSRVRLKLGRDR